MKITSFLICIATLAFFSACDVTTRKEAPKTSASSPEKEKEKVVIQPSIGQPAGSAGQAQPAAGAAAQKPAKKGEVVFDPRNPPAGYVNCHRGHCHKQGGGVASYQQVMQAIGATRIEGMAAAPKMPAAPSDVEAPPADAIKTPSGLASKVLSKGKGTVKPTADSRVTVHYTGWTTDGKAFDSSLSRGKPATFPLKGVIPGWTEGLQLMVEGEERRFWIPAELAYAGKPGRPQGMLVFDVMLLKIQ